MNRTALLKFWENPELIRHVRASLRPARAMTMALLVAIILVLVGLSCWVSENEDSGKFYRLFYRWIMGLQFTVLGIWVATQCSQAVSRERVLKTYDFLVTTRLGAAELLIGKVLGAPILAYFCVGLSIPVGWAAGLAAGYSPGVMVGTLLLLVFFALFVGVTSLWLSMLVGKSGGGLIGLVGLIPHISLMGMSGSIFPGWAGLSIFTPLYAIYDPGEVDFRMPVLFGAEIPFPILTPLLYLAFGAWFVLMLVRNLKKGREAIRLLTHWQALGFVAFLNVLFYALLDFERMDILPYYRRSGPEDVSLFMVNVNAWILLGIGLATLTPYERLKIWWRKRKAGAEKYLSEDGLPWPWIAMATGIAFLLLLAESAGMSGAVAFEEWEVGTAGLRLAVVLAFVARDVLFLQWCLLTRMKPAIVKGFLYLALYYTAAFIIAVTFDSAFNGADKTLMALTTPWRALFDNRVSSGEWAALFVGAALQVGVIVYLIRLIGRRLERTGTAASVPAPDAAEAAKA